MSWTREDLLEPVPPMMPTTAPEGISRSISLRANFSACSEYLKLTPRKETEAYLAACERHGVVIAEVGVWKNVFDPDPAAAAEAQAFAEGQLALADELGIPCCVNIAGSAGTAGWDAADPSNFTEETYERILRSEDGICYPSGEVYRIYPGLIDTYYGHFYLKVFGKTIFFI